jgi:hypothetical protein
MGVVPEVTLPSSQCLKSHLVNVVKKIDT